MAKVAFVSIMWHSRFVEELGVEYLTAVLRKETNHEVRIFYKFPEDNYNDFFQQVIGFNPDIVGISLSHKYTGLEPLYAGASLLKDNSSEYHKRANFPENIEFSGISLYSDKSIRHHKNTRNFNGN